MASSRANGSLIARIRLARPDRPLAAFPSASERLPSRHPPVRRRRGRRPVRPARLQSRRLRWLRALARHRRIRIALLSALVSLPLLTGGWLWLRHSSLVAVQRVRVSGLHGAEAQAIEAALRGAARHMSTLDVNLRALRAAVAAFPVVREVHASASPPHGLSIRVTEQLPVAALLAGATRTAVAPDGVVLGPALLSSGLPTVSGSSAPATGARVSDPALLDALTVLGAAPAPFARVMARVFSSSSGLTVAMRNGLLAYFGDSTRPHAKWLSLARVLADPSSAAATYVDVRVPEHPAAGFPAGAGPPAPTGGASGSIASTSSVGSEATITAIAERLAGAKEGEAAANGAEPSRAGEPHGGAAEPGSSASPATRAEGEEASSGGAEATGKGH